MAERRNRRGIWAGAATAVGAVFLALLGAGMLPFGGQRESYVARNDAAYDDGLVTSQPENLPGPAPAPAQTDTGSRYVSPQEAVGALFVNNHCDRTVRIAFAYLSSGRWETHGGADWDILANDGKYPLLGDQPLRPESSEIYIDAHTLDNVTVWRGDRIFEGARTLNATQAAVDVDQMGRKVITLTCSEPVQQTNAPAAAE